MDCLPALGSELIAIRGKQCAEAHSFSKKMRKYDGGK